MLKYKIRYFLCTNEKTIIETHNNICPIIKTSIPYFPFSAYFMKINTPTKLITIPKVINKTFFDFFVHFLKKLAFIT